MCLRKQRRLSSFEYCIFPIYDLQVVCLNGLYESFGILFLLLVDTEVSSDKIQTLQKEVLHLIIFVLLQLNPRRYFEVMRILCQ